MLRIVDLNSPPPKVENPYPYPLDPFQIWACSAIDKHENVLVTAKTGSGKTLVGEYQIKVSLGKGKRVFYTTPIKSLSNQKFHDLKELGHSVGILTGDIKFCPQADIVVMTTEILCNLLFNKSIPGVPLSLDDVDAVIFDEVHYINNPERGKVWEQCLMLLDPSVNLVLLSATIDDAPRFATWLGDLKQKPIHLISTQYRVVPLIHKVGNETVLDASNRFYADAYNRWLHSLERSKKSAQIHKDKVKDRRRGGYADNVVEKEDRSYSFLHSMNEAIQTLPLPALFFVFSRKQCEEYARKVSSNLLTSSESASVRHIIQFHLHKYTCLHTSPQYHEISTLLEKGVAYHHSGLLPVLKEIIEILFTKGFVKVLMATETFAVGINMPTKTVVFTSYRKHDGMRMRMLNPDEYIQMAGRAGRRGKDTEGLVVYLPDRDPSTLEDVRHMMGYSYQRVRSRMDFGYDFLLKTYYSSQKDWKELSKDSYWYQQNQDIIKSIQHDLDTVIAKRDALQLGIDEIEHYTLRRTYESRVHASVNSAKREAQKQLDTFKKENPHDESRWILFQEWSAIHNESIRIEEELRNVAQYEKHIQLRVDFLEELGYLDRSHKFGEISSHICEGHPILMSWVYWNRIFEGFTSDMLVGCLSIFLKGGDDKQNEVYLDDCACLDVYAYDAIKMVKKKADEYAKKECIPSDWNIDPYWVDVAIRWVRGENAFTICSDYHIYEGNFIRAMLQLANIVEEWVTMATLTNDLATLELFRDIRSVIVRDIVVPDSLYLRS